MLLEKASILPRLWRLIVVRLTWSGDNFLSSDNVLGTIAGCRLLTMKG
jgi:hypothetical protein